ncbi:hypothetical protein LLE49_09085 [Alicyclobacillus tolerans]|uniref:hypothetical protein n=1 Tax=Alicyclobacillus tolerans TaxID=90970 RepID=UPI001F251A6C|nr:hypothetical protein [Alicyclobacillus tolerans]MCF8564871.1 hypothetical protein [Alicyclobacillus tolerans]
MDAELKAFLEEMKSDFRNEINKFERKLNERVDLLEVKMDSFRASLERTLGEIQQKMNNSMDDPKSEFEEMRDALQRIEGYILLVGRRLDRHTHKIADIEEKIALEED